MRLTVHLHPNHRLADLADVKLSLLELGYALTIDRAGNLVATHPAQPIPNNRVPLWPHRPHLVRSEA